MANILKNIFYFLVSISCFSICFTTVTQFALWLHQTGFATGMPMSKLTSSLNNESNNIQKSIILHNLLLILLFVVQHSLMATDCCKQFLNSLGLGVLQRCIYVIATCAALQILMSYWLPLYPDYPVWEFDEKRHVLWFILTILHIIAWVIMFGVVLIIDYGELIGVKQVYYDLINSPSPMQLKSFSNRRMFQHFRHPILLGLLLVLWFVPMMTLDRLFLAIILSLYTCLGHRLDAQDYGYLQMQLQQKYQHLKTVQYSYWYE